MWDRLLHPATISTPRARWFGVGLGFILGALIMLPFGPNPSFWAVMTSGFVLCSVSGGVIAVYGWRDRDDDPPE